MLDPVAGDWHTTRRISRRLNEAQRDEDYARAIEPAPSGEELDPAIAAWAMVGVWALAALATWAIVLWGGG